MSCSESVIDELKPLLKRLSQHKRERFNVLQNNVIWEGKGLEVWLEGGHLQSEEKGALGVTLYSLSTDVPHRQ